MDMEKRYYIYRRDDNGKMLYFVAEDEDRRSYWAKRTTRTFTELQDAKDIQDTFGGEIGMEVKNNARAVNVR